MISAGWLPVLAIIVPACTCIGWMVHAGGARLDARYPAPRPLWTPRHELEPERAVVDSFRERTPRHYPQLAPVVHVHLGQGVPGWPAQPQVTDYVTATPELLP